MQAFDGVRVLDFTHVLAGPFCTYQLAVMGADVVKIEDPSEPDMMRVESTSEALAAEGRGTRYACQAGNKRSIAVDIKTDAGRDIILKLAETADVVVSNFRNGVMDRLGIGAEALQAINPKLIYCTISGFGATGPKASDPAFDNVIQAYSGLLKSTGPIDGPAVKVGPPVLDYGTGAQAAFAIAAALFQRTRTGRGQRIDVSMLDAALMLMTTDVVDTSVRNAPPPLKGNSDPAKPGYALFDTAEGDVMIGAFTKAQYQRLWRAVGRDDVSEAIADLSLGEIKARLEADRATLAPVMRRRTAAQWEDDLNAAGVPAARVRTLEEALASPQVQGRRVLQHGLTVPESGEIVALPVAAFAFADDGPVLTRDAPRFGADTDAVLSELGFDEAARAALRNENVIPLDTGLS